MEKLDVLLVQEVHICKKNESKLKDRIIRVLKNYSLIFKISEKNPWGGLLIIINNKVLNLFEICENEENFQLIKVKI